MNLDPAFIEEPPRRVVGMVYVGTAENPQDIPDLWNRFIQREDEIDITGECFGVIRNTGNPEAPIEYMSGFESTGDVPEGMTVWNLPGGTYAKVTVNDLPEIRPTIMAFFSQWAPAHASEYALAEGPMLEHYPPAFPQETQVNLLFSVKAI